MIRFVADVDFQTRDLWICLAAFSHVRFNSLSSRMENWWFYPGNADALWSFDIITAGIGTSRGRFIRYKISCKKHCATTNNGIKWKTKGWMRSKEIGNLVERKIWTGRNTWSVKVFVYPIKELDLWKYLIYLYNIIYLFTDIYSNYLIMKFYSALLLF